MELSCNWKALQPKLQKENYPPNDALKRKRPNGKLQRTRRRVKGATTKPRPSFTDRNMGGFASRQDLEETVSNGSPEDTSNGTQKFSSASHISLASQNSDTAASITSAAAKKYVALDCEMVGVGPTPDIDSVVARVSVVNYHGAVLYDTFVLPPNGVKITDYRTAISGIRPEHLKPRGKPSRGSTANGELPTDSFAARHSKQDEDEEGKIMVNIKGQPLASLRTVQEKLDEFLADRVLIGHALKNDFHTLFLSHPHASIRDTARYLPFRVLAGGRTPSLRKLAKQVLGREIQTGEHSSVEDAKAAMDIFKSVRKEWETGLRPYKGNGKKGPAKGKVPNAKAAAWGAEDDEVTGDEDEDEEGEDEDEDEGQKGVKAKRDRRKARLKKKKTKKRTKRA